MSDLAITAANVIAQPGATIDNGIAGAVVTAGQAVYFDAGSSSYKLAECDNAAAAVRSPDGIALNSAGISQPLAVLTKGPIIIGATLTAGVAYYLSGTPGGICPVADLTSGKYPTILGIATSTTVLDILVHESGVSL